MERPPRYRGFSYPQGLMVLDEVTGEVVLVPPDGAPERQLRPPVGHPAELASFSLTPTDADRVVFETFPYPVAVVYARLFEESDPRQQCRLLVDTFATLLKLWSLALANDYLVRPELRDAALNELLAKDFQRPLISVWHLFSARALAFFAANKKPPFLRELPNAYSTLETKCRSPFIATARFQDASGAFRMRESKLGKIQALIKYRNSLAHGYNLPPAKARENLGTYLPVLREILGEARFLAQYPLFVRAGDGVVRLTGATPSGEREPLPVTGDTSPVFLLDERDKSILPLETLATFAPLEHHDAASLDHDLFLFEGNTKNALHYASSRGEHLETQDHAARWRELLAGKAIESALLSRDRLNLETLHTAAARITSATLGALTAAGKYVSEVVYRPNTVEERLAQLDLGDHRAAVFLGEGGSGKSTLAASYAETRAAAGDVIVFYRASSLLDADLQARLLRDLGLRDQFFEDFLATADPIFQSGKARLRVIVDGVNEHPGDVAQLVGALDAMVRQAADYPWFRAVFTARTAAYERLKGGFGRLEGTRYLMTTVRRGAETEPSPVIHLAPLTNAEVGILYERYRAYRPPPRDDGGSERGFRPLTPFTELEAHDTARMMRNPLMMRLILAAFDGRTLDADLSYDAAMNLYFDEVIVTASDREGAHWERAAFLKALIGELDQAGCDSIERDALYEVPALRRALQNTGKDSPYVQLLDLGVLTEQWDRERCLVRFAFDRLFEFLLARAIDAACAEPMAVAGLARRAAKFGALQSALNVAFAARCRNGRASELVAALAVVAGTAEQRVLERVIRAVAQLLAREAPALQAHLDALATASLDWTLNPLLDAFDTVFAMGDVAAASAIAVTATKIAPEDPRALFRTALLNPTIDAFAAIKARAGDDRLLAARASVRQVEILRARGRNVEALMLLDGAATVLEGAGQTRDAADARRQQAAVLVAQSQLAAARTAAEAASALARTSGDQGITTECCITEGVVAWRQGDSKAATSAYSRALAMAEAEGHVRNMARAIGNLAFVARERGEFAEAVKLTERHLALGRRVNDQTLIGYALQNLGVMRFEAGDVAGARVALGDSFAHWTAADAGAIVATVLVNRGALALHEGDAERGRELLEEARAKAKEHANEDARLDASWLLGDVAALRGSTEPRRLAQAAALERSSEQWPAIEAAFRDASPMPEVHELPIEAAIAAGHEAVARAWLRGRPHRSLSPNT
jgi:hypothetical protein